MSIEAVTSVVDLPIEGSGSAQSDQVQDLPEVSPLRREADPNLPETVDVTAFGQKLSLLAPRFQFLRADSIWRLQHIYQPALATQILASKGVAIDIGAGFGAFALPFAVAFPDWQVFCFEPETDSFAALLENVQKLRLTNVIALPFAVGHSAADAPVHSETVRAAVAELAKGNASTLLELGQGLPQCDYSRSLNIVGYVERGLNETSEYEGFTAPTLAASFLTLLGPSLLKITAPGVETGIIQDLKDAKLDHLIGESWTHIPAKLVNSNEFGLRQAWIPRAGVPMLGLRRSVDFSARHAQLDIVVAMFNARDTIAACLDSLLADPQGAIRAIVVDDGSTDGSGEVVLVKYGDDPRVTLLRKPNGGCASARNFGRMHSEASHIAFVDADGVPSADLFPGLLELALLSGAEMVQGGYHFLIGDDEKALLMQPSAESTEDLFVRSDRHDFGGPKCHLLPTAFLIEGRTSIWRRIYRRDFLDNRKIWFPEHIKAGGDSLFQLLTLQQVYDVPVLDGVSYGHRQRFDPALRPADDRDFYRLEVFRLAFKRGVSEAWRDLTPISKAFIAMVNQNAPRFDPFRRHLFVKAAAELWAYARKTFGPAAFAGVSDAAFKPVDFAHYSDLLLGKLKAFDDSYAWAYLDGLTMQPPLVRI